MKRLRKLSQDCAMGVLKHPKHINSLAGIYVFQSSPRGLDVMTLFNIQISHERLQRQPVISQSMQILLPWIKTSMSAMLVSVADECGHLKDSYNIQWIIYTSPTPDCAHFSICLTQKG